MPATMASLSAALIDDRTDMMIHDTFNEDVDAWEDFQVKKRTWIGNQTIIVLKVARNGAVVSTLNSTEPAAGQQGYLRLTLDVARVLGKMQIDDFAMVSAEGEKGSVAVEPEEEMKGLLQDFTQKLCQFTFTGGPVMGIVWERKAAGLTYGYRGRSDDVQVGAGKTVRFIRLDTYAAVGADTQMTAITSRQLTLSANIDTSGVPAGTPIAVVNVGSQATAPQTVNGDPVGAFDGDPFGFLTNLCQVSHYGNNRNTNLPAGSTRLRANFLVVGNTNAADGDALAGTDMDRMAATIRSASGKRLDRYWTSWTTQVAYADLLLGTNGGNVRVDAQKGPSKLDPSAPVAKMKSSDSNTGRGGIPVHCSVQCPDGLMFAICNDSWERSFKGPQEGAWITADGARKGNPIMKVQGKTEYEATRALYYQLIGINPRANGVIAAIADPV